MTKRITDQTLFDRSIWPLSDRHGAAEADPRSLGSTLRAPKFPDTQIVVRDADSHHLNEESEENNKTLRDEIKLLRKDNELLRTSIVQKGSDTQPLRAEEYYARTFRELKADIEMWIARRAKPQGSLELSITAELGILEKLASFGDRGQWSADFLKADRQVFQSWYRSPRSRIQLCRHVLASILMDQVFVPFVFGLPSEVGNALAWVERDINARGLASLFTTIDFQNRSLAEF